MPRACPRTMGRPARRLARTSSPGAPGCWPRILPRGGKDLPTPLPPCIKRWRYPLPRSHVGASAAPTNGSTCRGHAPFCPLTVACNSRAEPPLASRSSWGFPLARARRRGGVRRWKNGRRGGGGRRSPVSRRRRCAATGDRSWPRGYWTGRRSGGGRSHREGTPEQRKGQDAAANTHIASPSSSSRQ
jgi:hypothetical protein